MGVTPETVTSIDAQLRSVTDYLGRIDRRWPPDDHTSWPYLAEKAEQLERAASALRRDLDAAAAEVA